MHFVSKFVAPLRAEMVGHVAELNAPFTLQLRSTIFFPDFLSGLRFR